jgi:hypothetical protein
MAGPKNVKVDVGDFGDLSKMLGKLAKRGIPYAARNAVNGCAFEARKAWLGRSSSDLVLRNTFTQRSMRIDKATGTKVEGMKAELGSTSPYMGTQEEGGDVGPRSGAHRPIPTTSSAGQGLKRRPRTRPVQGKNLQSALTVGSRPQGSNRRYRNMLAVVAAAAGNGIAYLDLGKRKGLFRVVGLKRRIKITMLWDLSRPRVHLKGTHTLEKALVDAAPRMRKVTHAAIEDQVKRAVMSKRRRR